MTPMGTSVACDEAVKVHSASPPGHSVKGLIFQSHLVLRPRALGWRAMQSVGSIDHIPSTKEQASTAGNVEDLRGTLGGGGAACSAPIGAEFRSRTFGR